MCAHTQAQTHTHKHTHTHTHTHKHAHTCTHTGSSSATACLPSSLMQARWPTWYVLVLTSFPWLRTHKL